MLESDSHVIIASQLAKSVASRGHDVTLLIASHLKVPEDVIGAGIKVERYNNPRLAVGGPEWKKALQEMLFAESTSEWLQSFSVFMGESFLDGSAWIKNESLVNQLRDAKFDHAVIDFIMPIPLILPRLLGIPYSIISPVCSPWYRSVPNHLGFIPTFSIFGLGSNDEMTLTQKLVNVMLNLADMGLSLLPADKEFYPDYLEPRTYGQLISEADLCFTIRNNLIDFIRPQMPDAISMTSAMTRPALPLSDEFETIMSESKRGVILVSFGSLMPEFPDRILEELLAAFNDIPYDIIFKYGKQVDTASHVHIKQWVPQNDLLAHPNIRAFVTHCGFCSTIEAIYHGVPLVMVPIGLDQFYNADMVYAKGLGEKVSVPQLKSKDFSRTVRKVVENPIYRQRVQHLSAVLREVLQDQGMDPGFWLEHVIKHGVSHLRSQGYGMPWYSYLMLDIYFVLICITSFLFVISYVFIKLTLRIIRKCSRKPKRD